MKTQYTEIRKRLHELDIHGDYLAELVSRTYMRKVTHQMIKDRFCHRTAMEIDICRLILKLIQEDESKLHEYFPMVRRTT